MHTEGRSLHLPGHLLAVVLPGLGLTQVQVPQAHCPQAPKAIQIRVCYVDAILMLAYQHYPVDGHFFSIWGPGSFCRFLEFGPHLLVKLGGVTALESEDLLICCHAEDTLLDDSAGVCPDHLDIGVVIHCVNGA